VSLLRSNLLVAAGTALSRMTGLVRWGVFFAVLGKSALTDAYTQANATPNIVYELILGGVMSSSLVPLITRLHHDDDRDAQVVVRSVLIVALALVTIAAVIAAPWIFRIYGPAATDVDPQLYRRVGSLLAALFLIQIFFYGLTAIASAELNARGRFMAAAWAPAVSNVAIVASLVIVNRMQGATPAGLADVVDDRGLRLALGLGATLGIALMAMLLIPSMVAAQVPAGFRFDLKHPAIEQLRRVGGWAIGYVIANHVAIVVIQNLLGRTDTAGAKSAYALGFALFVLPHGLLAMSIATTFLPDLTRAVSVGDKQRLIDRSAFGLRLVAIVTIPAGFGLFVLRRPIVGLAAQYGAFNADDALAASRALAGFALGLGGFSLYLLTLRTMYAHRDARSPFIINVGENLINVALALVLYERYGVLGIAAAFAVAYWVSALWSLQVIGYKISGYPVRGVLNTVAQCGVASLAMMEAVWFVARAVGSNSGAGAWVRVAAGIVVGTVVYGALLTLMGNRELGELRAKLTHS
jgi:putative peptidoglycan lipid II flippase